MASQLAPVSDTSAVKRDGPVLAVSWPTQGCRPGYAGKEDPPGASTFLDFVKMPTVLKDLSEDNFRATIVQTALAVEDLGLNRDKGRDRSEAYLDMATWDDAYRKSWANDNSVNSSSCGMVVRNLYWLCGLRGTKLFDSAYKGGVLTDLVRLDNKACKGWNSGFTAKTFFPKVGDALYLYDPATNSQHIFILCAIDKKIVDEGGVATVYDEDGTPASEITFMSVDGGQADDVGKDGNGTSKKWGCQGIKKVFRKMTLKDGHFLNIGVKWPKPDGPGRPINTWISAWELREKFTAQWIKPNRIGAINQGGVIGAPIPRVEPKDDSANPVDFYTWPTYTSPVPASILNKVAENRKAIPLPASGFVPFKVDGVATGYSYPAHGKNLKPANICSPEEAADPRLRPIMERLNEEMSGEGGVSAILTGDGAQFTWGRGLAHNGALEKSFMEFITRDKEAKRRFLDCGIILEDKTWKVVDLESNTVQSGESAIGLLNGTKPEAVKKNLLSVFIKITEDHLASASQAQWDVFKKLFFYDVNPRIPPDAIANWTPEAICYVVHCHAWGKFANWTRFGSTGGDLKKILRLEVDYTGFYEDKGTHTLVPAVQGNRTPALTMLNNMGHGHMKTALEPWQDEAELKAKVQKGDVVFQMYKGTKPAYYCLRGTERAYDPNNKYDIWVEQNHAHSMENLLAAIEKLGKKEAQATHDRYVSAGNPNKGKWGLRPQIALEAFLNKNAGIGAAGILEKARTVGITLASTPDQYLALARMIGVDKYDAWVEKNHALPMDYLVKAAGNMKYQETQAHRDWYTSGKNQKKEKFGPRPRIAMDAILHKGEGPGASWILNECEWAGIGKNACPDQYDIIKRTIGT